MCDLDRVSVRAKIKAKRLLVEIFRVSERSLKLIDGALSGLVVVLVLQVDLFTMEFPCHRNLLCEQLPPKPVCFIQCFVVVYLGIFDSFSV